MAECIAKYFMNECVCHQKNFKKEKPKFFTIKHTLTVNIFGIFIYDFHLNAAVHIHTSRG